jgi:bifunctional non-homologous end joining protein LigD
LKNGLTPASYDNHDSWGYVRIKSRTASFGRTDLAEQASIRRIGRQEVKITRPQKVLFPDDGISKGDLIEYYERVSRWMLPHLKQRALAMQRYPEGIDKPAIFQKEAGFYFPEWIEKVTVKKAGGTVTHVVCNNAAILAYLANQACITPHIWLSRVDKLNYPDQMVFDLDPSGTDFSIVKSAAPVAETHLR